MSSRTSDTISAGQAPPDTEKGLDRERSSQETNQAGFDEERSAIKEANKDMASEGLRLHLVYFLRFQKLAVSYKSLR